MRTKPCLKIETVPPAPLDSAHGLIDHHSVGQSPTLVTVAAARCDESRDLWQATVAAIWPWKRHGYKGWSVAAATALDYAPRSTRRWACRGAPVSHAASLRIIALLERQLATLGELLHAWRAYAAERARIEATTTPGFRFRSFAASERSGWRSKPRIPQRGGS